MCFFWGNEMALSREVREESLRSLIREHNERLNETDKRLLEYINNLAAQDDIPLHTQEREVIDFLIKTIKESKTEQNPDLEGTSLFIYGLITELMEAQSARNRQRHLIQGRFDETGLYLRAERDQMQDHDMTLLMPKSNGHIVVMAVTNRFDPHSSDAIIESLANDIFNPEVQHIMIPVGPGHWRGVYLTKPKEDTDEVTYDLELFDPYGPSGAATLDHYVLDLLNRCGVPPELVKIRHTGPIHPQGDAYSCGDFTCAHSHKKMKEFGAPRDSYNQVLIDTLDNLGNEDNVLRLATREESRALIDDRKGSIVPVIPDVSIDPSDRKESSDKLKPQTIPTQTHEENKPFPATRVGLFIGGTTLGSAGLGAIIGGVIGFFLLPGVGALVGAGIGAAIGAGAGFIASGVLTLFSWNAVPELSTTKPDEKVSISKESQMKSNTKEQSRQHCSEREKDPIYSPPLFSTSSRKDKTPKENTDELSSSSPKKTK